MKEYLKKIVKILSLQELRIFPYYLSYNFVLAIIPTFTLLFLVAGIFSISSDTVINFIDSIIPSNISKVLIDIISSKNYTLPIGILNIITLYASSKGMFAIIEASNNLYNVQDKSVTKDRLKAMFILLQLIIIIIFLILIPGIGGRLLSLLEKYDLITKTIISIYHILKWPLTFLVILINVIIIYIISPAVKLKVKDVILGAFITTILWSLFTGIFSYYLTYFAKYDVLYGGLSSITILLIWIYFLSYILILGIVINTRKYNKIEKR